MAIAGLGTYQSRSMYYSVNKGLMNYDSGNENPFMNQLLTFHNTDRRTVQDADGNSVNENSEVDSELRFGVVQAMSPIGEYGELKPYTRCITANIHTKEMIASESDGEMIYSYHEEEKSFNIFINCDGEKKTYTIKGTDENGQEIEEEFDPYDLDPEMMDFPEFSALCMYIRQTDETADLMTKMAFTDGSVFNSIFEKGDRISMLKDYAEEYQKIKPDISELALGLFDAINEFLNKMARNVGVDDEKIALLLADNDHITEQEISDEWNGKLETGVSGNEEPAHKWYDGRFGYHVEVFKNEGSESEYTVKMRYNDGREVSRIVDAEKLDPSDCNIVDFTVRMAHLCDEGKISQEDYMMDVVIANFNMEHWMSDANETSTIDFRYIFERQLELELNSDRDEKHIAGMLTLLNLL